MRGKRQKLKERSTENSKLRPDGRRAGADREWKRMNWKSQTHHASSVFKYCNQFMGIDLSFYNACHKNTSGFIMYCITDTQLKIMNVLITLGINMILTFITTFFHLILTRATHSIPPRLSPCIWPMIWSSIRRPEKILYAGWQVEQSTHVN